MKKLRKLLGVICLICALVVMQLPASEAIAANEASDFSIFEETVLTKYVGKSPTVVIPDGIQTIATDAFKNNTGVTTVIIPKSVTKIEPYAFWGCSVSKVTLGGGLKEIGDYAFANCKKLTTIDIPDNIERIGLYAFEDNISLTDADITYKTMDIHKTAFDGCYKLVIHAPEGSYPYKYAQDFAKRQQEFNEYEDVSNFDPNGNSSNGNGSNSVSGNGDGGAGNGAEGNSGSGDSSEGNGGSLNGNGGSSIEFIYNPDGTVSSKTDYSSIMNDNSDVYGSVHVVGNQAVVFMDSASPNVYSGSNPPSYGGSANGSENGASSGTGSGTGIGDGAFENSGLAKYTIVDDRIVADQAYYCNTKVNYVALPSTIKEIGQFAYARSSLSSILLPNGLERISYGAFYHCDNLESVTIPETVLFVEPNAFKYTAWVNAFTEGNLTTEAVKKTSSEEDFLISGGVLIAYRGNAETVTIPDGVRSIAAEVFEGHEEIKKVVIPKNLVVIGEESFSSCSSLGEINLENSSVKYILDRAFANTALEKTVLPSALSELGINAFDNDVVLFYLGSAPAITHEASAERLSNPELRNKAYEAEMIVTSGAVPENSKITRPGEDETVGVRVVVKNEGETIENADYHAYLEAAKDSYVLNITSVASDELLTTAMKRAEQILGDRSLINPSVYDMVLTDKSGIPITKLGKVGLTIAIPVPETVNDATRLTVLTIDRNGQLEELPAETVSVEGKKYVRFITYHLSPFAIYSTGNLMNSDDLIIADEVISALTASPDIVSDASGLSAGDYFVNWVKAKKWRLIIAGGFVAAGIVLLATKTRKYR